MKDSLFAHISGLAPLLTLLAALASLGVAWLVQRRRAPQSVPVRPPASRRRKGEAR